MKKTFKKLFVPNTKTNPRPVFWHPVFVGIFVAFTFFVAVIFLFDTQTKSESFSWLGDIRSGVLIAFTNQERTNLALDELTESELLNQAATLKAEHMAQHSYFAHYSPEGISPWFWFTQVNYSYERAGENLAVLFTHSRDIVRAWMNSPTHRANIVKEGYTEIGIGTAQGVYKGKNTTYVVQLFAKPKETTLPALFTFQTQTEKVSDDVIVLGAETRVISFANLFQKEYILFTILMLISGVLFVGALVGISLFFIKKNHNSAILKVSVLGIFISMLTLAYIYFSLFDSVFLK